MKKPSVNHNGNHGHGEARQNISSAVQDDGFEPLLDSEEAAALLNDVDRGHFAASCKFLQSLRVDL